LDYNPNKPHLLVTSGKDGLLKFWDLRKTGGGYFDEIGNDNDSENLLIGGPRTKKKKQRPLLVCRGGHNHWATRVKYNPFHDQLILSSGTDSLVNLWRVSTISSAPLLTFDEEPQRASFGWGATTTTTTTTTEEESQPTPAQHEGPNIRVSRHEHLDSVNAIAWGAADAWIYVSASYDGKVELNHVPSKEKYKILL